MKMQQVLQELENRYPGKRIIKNDDTEPTEIICEVEPCLDHPEYSKAISVIDRSKPHVHQLIEETYTVLEGELHLVVDGRAFVLKEGDSRIIKPGQTHWAWGDSVWVECISKPGWIADDHKLVREIVPEDSRYVPLTQQRWCCVPTCIQMVMSRHGIPLQPAELIGYEMGLVLPVEALSYFYNGRTGEKPPAGYGTQVGKSEYGPNAVFKRLGIPLKMSWRLIDTFENINAFRNYLDEVENGNQDVLICYDWPSLFEWDKNEHWGHVCVLDRVFMTEDKVRFIDPSGNAGKWISVPIPELHKAMVVHGKEKSGGFWILERVGDLF